MTEPPNQPSSVCETRREVERRMSLDRSLNGLVPSSRCTPTHEPLPEWLIELTAEYLQAIAEPHRIALLKALTSGEAGVQELADVVELPHQNASYHLALLRRAGILSRRPVGSASLYAIEDWSAWWVVEQITGVLR